MNDQLLSHKYITSNDYSLLWDMMREHVIVCLVNYDEPFNGYQIRDVCQTPLRFSESSFVDISCRGYAYISARDKDDFIRQCEKKNLEFFMPDTIAGNFMMGTTQRGKTRMIDTSSSNLKAGINIIGVTKKLSLFEKIKRLFSPIKAHH